MTRADLALALVSLVWGTTFVLIKNAIADVSIVLFLTLRFGIATAILALVYLVRRGKVSAHGLLPGVVTGTLLYAGYLFQTLGLRHTTPATSGFITGLYVPMVPMLSAAIYRKPPGISEWTGVALAGVGMALLTLESVSLIIGSGELLTLACAFAFACHILALGHYSQRVDTDRLALFQIATCALIGSVCFGWVEPVFVRWTPSVILAIAITSVFATALAFWIQTWAQARTTPTRAAILFSLEPVFAWLTSWLAQGEVLTVRAAAGAGCVLTGILLVELKPIRLK